MYFEIQNPKELLEKAGYQMVGISNAFRRHIETRKWYHCLIEHDGTGVKIHVDWAKNGTPLHRIYKKHKTCQRSEEVEKEIMRIKDIEQQLCP